MSYNPNIHNRQSTRLKAYDYSQAGLYFITICTFEKEQLFGKIEQGNMFLNTAGLIANKYWLDIPKHYPQVILHAHVIMPNHVHGIIEIVNLETDKSPVGVQNFEPLHKPTKHKFQKIIPRSIGSIVRGYKIGVTKWFRKNTDIQVVWQRNYHDHIIRDEKGFVKISEYIQANPLLWKEDRYCV